MRTLSLIKEALDKAKRKSEASTDDLEEPAPGANRLVIPDRGERFDVVKFLLWTLVVFGISVVCGFELIYLLSLL